jgi:hypothetical protein
VARRPAYLWYCKTRRPSMSIMILVVNPVRYAWIRLRSVSIASSDVRQFSMRYGLGFGAGSIPDGWEGAKCWPRHCYG